MNELWENIQEEYISATKEVFRNFNDQRTFVSSRFAEIQVRFIEILKKQGEKPVMFYNFALNEYQTSR